jgi:hypothetical protein
LPRRGGPAALAAKAASATIPIVFRWRPTQSRLGLLSALAARVARSAHCCLRVHRGFLQSAPTTLIAGVSITHQVRAPICRCDPRTRCTRACCRARACTKGDPVHAADSSTSTGMGAALLAGWCRAQSDYIVRYIDIRLIFSASCLRCRARRRTHQFPNRR